MKLEPYTIKWSNGVKSYIMGESFEYAHKVAKAHGKYRVIYKGIKQWGFL